ncbi:3-phosphoshikimate 1-carboxyvinyltransferase [Thermoproteota archaeon]
MSIKINQSTVYGTVNAPPSKSMTHRYLITSALAEGTSTLSHPLKSDDTITTVIALRNLGIQISEEGKNWVIDGGSLNSPNLIIDCKESGTTLRFITGVCSLIDKPCTLTGSPSLLRRPNGPLLRALEQLGVETQSQDGYPPITVKGKLVGGKAQIRGDVSSQFISSIILVAPYSEEPVELKILKLESKPYVQMTLDAMRNCGINTQHSHSFDMINVPIGRYHPVDTWIEGDWSSAAFILGAGVLSGKVHVDFLNIQSSQADKKILRILDELGGYLKIKGNRVTTEKSSLTSIEANLSDCPDIFPIVSCLCSVAKGKSKLTGLGRLKIKESDRLVAMVKGLKKMGIKTSIEGTSIIIEGGKPRGAVIDPHNDHRIAMSFAILGLTASGVTTVMNPECVSKSYPMFWDDLKRLRARID